MVFRRGARNGDKKHSDRSVFCRGNLHVRRRRDEHPSVLPVPETSRREEFAAVHSSVSRRILPFFGPVLVFTGLSQHSANLVSPSIYFHVVDRTHSGDSSAHGGHPFCGV